MRTPESTAIFRKSWSLYDLITAHNYMFHRELYADLEELLKQVYQANKSYQLLDLGCGNARFLSPSLKKYPPSLYEGVDLSEAALHEAQEYLLGLPTQTMFSHADLLQSIETTTQNWDIIFSGFALHHLMPVEKRRFFDAVSRCLLPGGQFILVDVIRENNQSRTEYLEGYLKFMRDKWIKVSSDQIDEACAHVAEHDYPESLAILNEMSQAAKLKSMRVVNHYEQHYILVFSHNS